jgi:hypothetical protein
MRVVLAAAAQLSGAAAAATGDVAATATRAAARREWLRYQAWLVSQKQQLASVQQQQPEKPQSAAAPDCTEQLNAHIDVVDSPPPPPLAWHLPQLSSESEAQPQLDYTSPLGLEYNGDAAEAEAATEIVFKVSVSW